MKKGQIIGLVIVGMLAILNGGAFFLYQQQQETLQEMIDNNETLKQDTIKARQEYEVQIEEINKMEQKVENYFNTRKEISLLEIMQFLEFAYPTHSNNNNFSITKNDENSVTYITTNFEQILQMERNFNMAQQDSYISSLSWDTISYEQAGMQGDGDLYTISFSFRPEKLRDFLLNGPKDQDFEPPVEQQAVLRHFYNQNFVSSIDDLKKEYSQITEENE